MEYKSKAQKLSELRAKTDRQLSNLVTRMLERGLSADAERFLPMLPRADRREFERKLQQMKELSTCKSVYAA